MDRWKNKVALVTGASSGIGDAIVRTLANAGMRIAACARRVERLDALKADIEGCGGKILTCATDLKDEAQIRHLFDAIRERWGGVDVLINNAGLGHLAPLMSGSSDEWREMLELNVLALCICTREAISDMQKRGDDGHVIHISSMAAHRVPGGAGLYSATKYAVRALTEGLRQELRGAASQIRVSSISPGVVETEFHQVLFNSEDEAKENYGRFKVLESGDIADAVLWVLGRPPHMQVHDVLIRPTDQPS